MEELNAIYERMRTIFSEEAGFVPNDGCDAMVRLYALASEVQALLAQADWVLNQSFPQTAAGRYLDYHAETRALTRLPAAKATGVLRFSAPSAAVTDYEIDAGSVAMTSGGVRFETTEKAVLSKGESHVDVPAIAVEAGANGNAIAGAIHLMSVYPVGITQCENPEAFSGGSDEESDEKLRERVLESYKRLPNGANVAFYEQEAMRFPTVASAKAVGRTRHRHSRCVCFHACGRAGGKAARRDRGGIAEKTRDRGGRGGQSTDGENDPRARGTDSGAGVDNAGDH